MNIRSAGRSESGSILLLFPAAVLIVMVLAAITVDTSLAFLGQRDLAQATSAAANDAATEGLSPGSFYRENDIDLDVERVQAVAVARVTQIVDSTRHGGLQVTVDVVAPAAPGCAPRVRVSASSTVSYLFARAIPGGPDTADVHATSIATPRQNGEERC